MRGPVLAVSNIAWSQADEARVGRALAEEGVTAVEIAPTKVFDDPLTVTDAEVSRYLSVWAALGVEVVAFQSMLFGYPDLQLFGDRQLQDATMERLAGFIDLAGRMGVSALVFGSPKNRLLPPEGTEKSVWPIAVDVFGRLGDAAAAAGTVFCIEPNPPQYGCDFVTGADAGARLVRDVGHPGFRLHLDAAGMTLAGDDIGDSIRDTADILHHYHVSAPGLGLIESDIVAHEIAFDALRDTEYARYVSIEMRPDPTDSVVAVIDAVRRVRSHAAAAGVAL